MASFFSNGNENDCENDDLELRAPPAKSTKQNRKYEYQKGKNIEKTEDVAEPETSSTSVFNSLNAEDEESFDDSSSQDIYHESSKSLKNDKVEINSQIHKIEEDVDTNTNNHFSNDLQNENENYDLDNSNQEANTAPFDEMPLPRHNPEARQMGISHVSNVQNRMYSHPYELDHISYIIMTVLLMGFFVGYIINWHMGVCFDILYLACVPFCIWWFHNRYYAPISYPLFSFGLGVVICIGTMVIQFVILVLVFLMFGRAFQNSIAFGFCMLIILVVGFVSLEEWMKFCVFIRYKTANPHVNETRKDLINAIFIALGFAFCQSGVWVVAMYDVIELEEVRSPISTMILVTLLFALWGTPLHILCAYLTGLLVNLETPNHKIQFFNVLYRSFYVLEMLLMLIYNSTLIFVCSLIVTICIYYALIIHIKLTEQLMPIEYLNRVGYLSAFGYGVLEEHSPVEENMV